MSKTHVQVNSINNFVAAKFGGGYVKSSKKSRESSSMYNGAPEGSALRGNNNSMIKERERTDQEIACDNTIKENATYGAIGGLPGGIGGVAAGAFLTSVATVIVDDDCLDLV